MKSNNMFIFRSLIILISACGILFVTSRCVSDHEPGEEKRDTLKDISDEKSGIATHKRIVKEDKYLEKYTVKVKDVKAIKAKLIMHSGLFNITDNDEDVIDARFSYKEPEWKPYVEYTEEDGYGYYVLKMPRKGKEDELNFEIDIDNEKKNVRVCKLRMIDDIPLEMDIKFGAGKGIFDLSELKMRELNIKVGAGDIDLDLSNTSIPELEIQAGVGEAVVDLTGEWHNDLEADITCGIGELTLKLPRDVGVYAEAKGLIGEINAHGFHKKNRKYYNEAYEQSEYTLRLDIKGAIGEINLEMVD